MLSFRAKIGPLVWTVSLTGRRRRRRGPSANQRLVQRAERRHGDMPRADRRWWQQPTMRDVVEARRERRGRP